MELARPAARPGSQSRHVRSHGQHVMRQRPASESQSWDAKSHSRHVKSRSQHTKNQVEGGLLGPEGKPIIYIN